MQSINEILARELGQKLEYVEHVVALMDEGNTIPFIARYRKEMHGAMDDTTLRNLETRLTYLRNLQQRREEVKKSIENQGKLTQELMDAIDAAATMTEVEDLYRPYKQKADRFRACQLFGVVRAVSLPRAVRHPSLTL